MKMDGYPELTNFIESCLHQDSDLIGDSLDEIIAYYIGVSSSEHLAQLKQDVSDFRQKHQGRLEAAFDDAYGFDFDPKLWESSVEDFCARVEQHLGLALRRN